MSLRRAPFTLLLTVVTGSFYLLLIDNPSPPELYAGAAVTVLAVAVDIVTTGAAQSDRLATGRALRLLGRTLRRAPLQILATSWEAIRAVAGHGRADAGRFLTVPVPAGGDRDTAAFELLGSLTPNTIVLGVDRDRRVALVHQLHPYPIDRDLRAVDQ